jgi:hypothetical protein
MVMEFGPIELKTEIPVRVNRTSETTKMEAFMLPVLNPDPSAFVDVQQTAFSHDVLGRWVCSTWPEVSNNGGDPFDVVVIGAGMFGGVHRR